MKVTVPNPEKRRVLKPVIGLDRPEIIELEKGQYHTYELRTSPTNVNSPTYKLDVPKFSTGTPEEWLKFVHNLRTVIQGQHVQDGPGRYRLARNLLKGDALSAFNTAATTAGNETQANFDTVLNSVTEHIFPARALRVQKRYMRRFLRKPKDMTTRQWISRVTELNNYLESFPPLRAGTAATKLPDDEILEILEFGIPFSWQKQMLLQNFDPIDKSMQEFTNFCDRLEDGLGDDFKPVAKNNSPSTKKKNSSKRKNSSENSKDCMLHGDNCGHSTDECRTLKAQAKRMKSTYEAQHPSKKSEYKKAQDLHAMVMESVQKALGEAKKPASKKKKSSSKEDQFAIDKFSELSVSDSDESKNDECPSDEE